GPLRGGGRRWSLPRGARRGPRRFPTLFGGATYNSGVLADLAAVAPPVPACRSSPSDSRGTMASSGDYYGQGQGPPRRDQGDNYGQGQGPPRRDEPGYGYGAGPPVWGAGPPAGPPPAEVALAAERLKGPGIFLLITSVLNLLMAGLLLLSFLTYVRMPPDVFEQLVWRPQPPENQKAMQEMGWTPA